MVSPNGETVAGFQQHHRKDDQERCSPNSGRSLSHGALRSVSISPSLPVSLMMMDSDLGFKNTLSAVVGEVGRGEWQMWERRSKIPKFELTELRGSYRGELGTK